MLTGILAGALPAIRAGRTDLNDALKEGGRSDAGSVGLRTRRLLIVCEVALSVVLLMGAGVMIRSLLALRNVDAGFDPRNVLTMQIALPETRYKTPAQMTAFFDAALQRIRALPGVQDAASDRQPAARRRLAAADRGRRPGRAAADAISRPSPCARSRPATSARCGCRCFAAATSRTTMCNVMLVSRAAAKLLWGDVDPIGRQRAAAARVEERSWRRSSASSATS